MKCQVPTGPEGRFHSLKVNSRMLVLLINEKLNLYQMFSGQI